MTSQAKRIQAVRNLNRLRRKKGSLAKRRHNYWAGVWCKQYVRISRENRRKAQAALA